MKKKPFWRRVNRGFVVSMALLAVVAVYVLVTQLMLLPDKNAVRSLADDVCALAENVSMLSEEEIASLQDPAALEAKKAEIREQLKPLFVEGSDYLEEAAEYFYSLLTMQTTGMQQVDTRGEVVRNDSSCQLEEDTASVSIDRQYKGSHGKFWDYKTEAAEEGDADESLGVSIVFKKAGGTWKIYRIGNLYMNAYTGMGYHVVY